MNYITTTRRSKDSNADLWGSVWRAVNVVRNFQGIKHRAQHKPVIVMLHFWPTLTLLHHQSHCGCSKDKSLSLHTPHSRGEAEQTSAKLAEWAAAEGPTLTTLTNGLLQSQHSKYTKPNLISVKSHAEPWNDLWNTHWSVRRDETVHGERWKVIFWLGSSHCRRFVCVSGWAGPLFAWRWP